MHSLYHIIPCVCPALRIKVPYSPYSFNKHKNEKYEHQHILHTPKKTHNNLGKKNQFK